MVSIPSSTRHQLAGNQEEPSVPTGSLSSYGSGSTITSIVLPCNSVETRSSLSGEPSSSSTSTPAGPSTHEGVIIGSVLGSVTFICSLVLVVFFWRRGYFTQCKANRRFQTPDPFYQEKVFDTSDPNLSLETLTIKTSSGEQDTHNRVEVPDERERLEQLESKVDLLMSEWQRGNGFEIQESPPDYISSTLDAD
ncbi:hypothetical protein IW261DRAFT_1532804 [Armillaria novae-zelandiae]|uniref:Uncharacterized protein n=1 Tax=Armillaria novae-zelandiae TaxID=153914 RepID=A0AA39N877_9AGAR|nr:hypothetical protein IW261DRAFT_1532804 [Armillaria novae-zelandiae]